MNAKAILYDLSIAGIAVTLWLTPNNLTRAIGYSVSLLFSGRAYYTGICLLNKERREDEKEAIAYEAEVDFYEQLVGTQIESELQVKSLEIENKLLQRLAPLLAMKSQLERQLSQVSPSHPEISEEEKQDAAKQAIESAFEGEKNQSDNSSVEPTEEMRKQFPEAMDAPSWKAILKALSNGASRDEIIKDVLGCSVHNAKLGGAYLDFLKQKFMV
jgi:hypothetical protein